MPRKRKGERPDGRIQLILDIGRDPDGKRLRKVFYGRTRAEAETKKAAYLEQASGVRYNTDMTLSEWIDAYLDAYPSKANPLYHAQNIVPYNRLKTALGDAPLSSIREVELQQFMNGLSGYSASTLSKQLQVTKAIFAKARKNKLIPDDPAEDLTAPQGSRGTHRALTRDEISLILDRWRNCPAGLWCMLMLFAGLRRSEMMALDWDAVDLTERTLTVKQVGILHNNKMIVEPRAKSAAGLRVIPIVEPLCNALTDVPEALRSGFVCRTANGKPLTETALKWGMERFTRILGFSFRCHDLRHTFATLLYDSGTDVKTAAYLLGHSDVMVTMRIYTHLSEQRRQSSTAALMDFFSAIK